MSTLSPMDAHPRNVAWVLYVINMGILGVLGGALTAFVGLWVFPVFAALTWWLMTWFLRTMGRLDSEA